MGKSLGAGREVIIQRAYDQGARIPNTNIDHRDRDLKGPHSPGLGSGGTDITPAVSLERQKATVAGHSIAEVRCRGRGLSGTTVAEEESYSFTCLLCTGIPQTCLVQASDP